MHVLNILYSGASLFVDSNLLIHLLKLLIYNSKINTCGAFEIISGHTRVVENLSCGMCMSPAEVEPGHNLPSHIVHKCPFCDLFSETFLTFLCFLLISVFEIGPKLKYFLEFLKAVRLRSTL